MKHVVSLRMLITFVIGAFGFSVVYGNEKPGSDEKVRVPVINLTPWFDATAVSLSSSLEKHHRDTKNTTLSLGSLTEEQLDIVNQIRRACREVGFFQIIGGLDSNDDNDKNVDDAMIQQTWKASREFFGLSIEEKLLHRTIDTAKYPYGYERSETLVRGKLLDGEDKDGSKGEVSPSVVAADLKETFAVGPPTGNGSGMPPRRWIESANVSPGFQTSLEAYYERMEELALVLLQIFAIALEEPPDFFENKMDHHMAALRLVHYYPLEKDAQSNTNKLSHDQGKPEPIARTRVVRAGAHTDYGALTILAAQDEGLEVLLQDTTVAASDGYMEGEDDDSNKKNKTRWYPVPLIPGAFVVNLGDLMQRWTNNEWVSTMHRVIMPSTEAQERRYSIAYFVNINGDTPIEPLKCCRGQERDGDGRVITAGEHLMAKHLASMGITADSDNAEAVSSSWVGEL